MSDPIKAGMQSGQTSEKTTKEESLIQDTIAGIASPSAPNKKGYSHFKWAPFAFRIKAIVKEIVGMSI
jgi:hypothetical protein